MPDSAGDRGVQRLAGREIRGGRGEDHGHTSELGALGAVYGHRVRGLYCAETDKRNGDGLSTVVKPRLCGGRSGIGRCGDDAGVAVEEANLVVIGGHEERLTGMVGVQARRT